MNQISSNPVWLWFQFMALVEISQKKMTFIFIFHWCMARENQHKRSNKQIANRTAPLNSVWTVKENHCCIQLRTSCTCVCLCAHLYRSCHIVVYVSECVYICMGLCEAVKFCHSAYRLVRACCRSRVFKVLFPCIYSVLGVLCIQWAYTNSVYICIYAYIDRIHHRWNWKQ